MIKAIVARMGGILCFFMFSSPRSVLLRLLAHTIARASRQRFEERPKPSVAPA
jgi:hypothetical protein